MNPKTPKPQSGGRRRRNTKTREYDDGAPKELVLAERFRNKLLSASPNHLLDFCQTQSLKLLAEAMGCVGLRCERPEDVDKTIEAAMAINDRPVVVDFNVII